MPFEPQVVSVKDTPMHVLSPKDLTRFINSAEWNLGMIFYP